MTKLFAITALAASLNMATSVTAQERPLTLRVVQSGHSLTDVILGPLRQIVASEGARGAVIDKSTIPGSGMDFRWEHSNDSIQTDARYNIDRYEMLVLTERVSLSGTMRWHNSTGEALNWFTHAWENGNGGEGAETVLYATWVNTNSGPDFRNPYKDPDGHIPFRERLPREMAGWEEIQDYVNANRPAGAPPMKMIPGPLLMAAIYDDIAAGRAPGFTDISDLFQDTIHLNEVGGYFIALAHYAVIYDRDPRGLQNIGSVTPEQAVYMQDLVWRILSEQTTPS
ncbi:hypothetical protein [Cognatiyoonia sp. IB215182]|uniref:hypothetical protein n=1 Tax=Cognatiyoonia sp. IB215182 TaxID=3097353 RepID=UPI002A10C0A5|nr:hypothetical protein [Cognatiyoonia sp. IB215182]MDX8353095.1 hypothetical protein [Cognatiyoonia sp. IB215182]